MFGKDFARDDVPDAEIERHRRLHIIALTQAEDLRPNGPHQRGPVQHAEQDGQHEIAVEADQRCQHKQQRKRRDRQDEVRNA